MPRSRRGTKLEENIHICDWYATFIHLSGGDVEDENTIGTRPDGSRYTLPGVDSCARMPAAVHIVLFPFPILFLFPDVQSRWMIRMNMWGLISGVEQSSPRTELPLVMDHPTSHNAALIVGDYKLLLGQIGLA